MRPHEKRPAVIICPGGGYGFTSDREAEPIAMQVMAMGYQAVVLRYSVAPERYPKQLLQLGSLMKHLKENAKEYHIDSDLIFVMGFSAGGHLAASVTNLWNDEVTRPDFSVLIYPVITMEPGVTHKGTHQNLLGKDGMWKQHYLDEFSIEKQVSRHSDYLHCTLLRRHSCAGREQSEIL